MAIHFRSIWISDTHLGGKNIQSRQLLEFLSNTESDYLYLVGHIIDLHQLGRKWYWPAIDNRIVNFFITKAKNGTKVFYLPGNYDAALRNYCGRTFINIHIRMEAVHTTADGRNFVVVLKDTFDSVIQNSPWLAHVGGKLYEKSFGLNRRYNPLRSYLGKEDFSISAYLKHKYKKALNNIGDFEEHLTAVIRKIVWMVSFVAIFIMPPLKKWGNRSTVIPVIGWRVVLQLRRAQMQPLKLLTGATAPSHHNR